ncbi:hypothetical protein JAAARDRAFT_193360 [Jaapia argillacea MUCL 33604]|uniref:DUF6532 domain-containing protein n=1 Tax=Jaapia argillacea MUCL 33604 TaxID=933084 RepID=A0A067PSS7_9AGAM|nr:hypothetical protein JAAARDRAFT_193360 [Jaapia argillacea MUCL 33604]
MARGKQVAAQEGAEQTAGTRGAKKRAAPSDSTPQPQPRRSSRTTRGQGGHDEKMKNLEKKLDVGSRKPKPKFQQPSDEEASAPNPLAPPTKKNSRKVHQAAPQAEADDPPPRVAQPEEDLDAARRTLASTSQNTRVHLVPPGPQPPLNGVYDQHFHPPQYAAASTNHRLVAPPNQQGQAQGPSTTFSRYQVPIDPALMMEPNRPTTSFPAQPLRSQPSNPTFTQLPRPPSFQPQNIAPLIIPATASVTSPTQGDHVRGQPVSAALRKPPVVVSSDDDSSESEDGSGSGDDGFGDERGGSRDDGYGDERGGSDFDDSRDRNADVDEEGSQDRDTASQSEHNFEDRRRQHRGATYSDDDREEAEWAGFRNDHSDLDREDRHTSPSNQDPPSHKPATKKRRKRRATTKREVTKQTQIQDNPSTREALERLKNKGPVGNVLKDHQARNRSHKLPSHTRERHAAERSPTQNHEESSNSADESDRPRTKCSAKAEGRLLLDYDPTWRSILRAAKAKYKAWISSQEAFPTVEMASLEAAESIGESIDDYQERFQTKVDSSAIDEEMLLLIHDEGSTFRGELKRFSRTMVKSHYNISEPPGFTSSMAHISVANLRKCLVNQLLTDGTFLHGPRDHLDRPTNFSHPVIKEICVSFFYGNKSKLGLCFPDIFGEKIPTATIALVATVVKNCLDEWTSGYHSGVEFSSVQYQDCYEECKGMMRQLQDDSVEGAAFEDMREEWAWNGR